MPTKCRTSSPTPLNCWSNLNPSLGAGQSIAVPVSARYLFGKALSRAQVKWWLQAEDTEFKPERFESFNFRRANFEFRFGRGSSSTALNGQGTLGGSSNFVITADLPVNASAPQPRVASLHVEVTDLNQQTISRRVEFMQHSSDFYLGLRQQAKVLRAGETIPLEVAAVRADGQPWPETVKAQVTLQRIDWEPVRIQGAGRTIRYRNEAVLTNVLEQEIEVQPIQWPTGPQDEVVGNRIPGWPPLPAGQYLVVAQAKDSGGRALVSLAGFRGHCARGDRMGLSQRRGARHSNPTGRYMRRANRRRFLSPRRSVALPA